MPSTTAILNDAKLRSGGLTQDDLVLMEWMNQEYRETNLQIAKSVPDYFLTSAALAITSGTDVYNLPADCIRVERIEDQNGNRIDEATREDYLSSAPPNTPGWIFYGYVIQGGVRYERIRIQPPNTTTATWTVWYVQNPPDLDLSVNTIPAWPANTHELLNFAVLMRWMEQDEQPERYAEYKNLRDTKRAQLFDLLGDRSSGLSRPPVITHPEDFN